ncbi:MAG: CCC motif membrane protein [Ferruginibacter sp.]
MEQRDLLNPTPNYQVQPALPNATASLVLGIIAIVGSFCYGIIGLICGIVGLILANKDKKLYTENPELYSPFSFSTSNAGRTCSIYRDCTFFPHHYRGNFLHRFNWQPHIYPGVQVRTDCNKYHPLI